MKVTEPFRVSVVRNLGLLWFVRRTLFKEKKFRQLQRRSQSRIFVSNLGIRFGLVGEPKPHFSSFTFNIDVNTSYF